jgi:hypothetical protein
MKLLIKRLPAPEARMRRLKTLEGQSVLFAVRSSHVCRCVFSSSFDRNLFGLFIARKLARIYRRFEGARSVEVNFSVSECIDLWTYA